MSATNPIFTLNYSAEAGAEADLALLLYDQCGQLLQVCFDGKSCPAITHSGDAQGSADHESAAIDFAKMSANVAFVVIAVALNGKNRDLLKSFSVLNLNCSQLSYYVNLLALSSTSPTPVHNFAPILLKRIPGTVFFQGVPMNAMDNVVGGESGLKHVWQVAEFVLKTQIPPLLWNQVSHSHVEVLALKAKQTVSIFSPHASAASTVHFFGLGWSPDKDGVDLDVHAYAIDVETRNCEHIYFNNKSSKDGALSLDGDDRTGDGIEGADDERLFTILNRVKRAVDFIFIMIRIYKKNNSHWPTFAEVKNEFCRAADSNGTTIVRFALDGKDNLANSHNVVMCVLRRDSQASDTWTMQAIGEPISESAFESEASVTKELLRKFN